MPSSSSKSHRGGAACHVVFIRGAARPVEGRGLVSVSTLGILMLWWWNCSFGAELHRFSGVVLCAARFCTTGLPSDVVFEVQDMSFHLHKVGSSSCSGPSV